MQTSHPKPTKKPKRPKKSKLRRFWEKYHPYIGAAGAAAFLGVGGALAVYALPNILSTRMALPAMLEADTQLLVEVTPSLPTLLAMPALLQVQGGDSLQFHDLQRDLENSLGISIAQDVLPWVGGEIGLAICGYHPESGNITSPEHAGEELASHLVLAAAVRDQDKVKAFLGKLGRKGKGVSVSTREHRGVSILERRSSVASVGCHFAVFNGFLVMTTDRTRMEEAIDRVSAPKNSLRDGNKVFKAIQSRLRGRTLGYAYVDGSLFADLADCALEQVPEDQAESVTESLRNVTAVKGIGVALLPANTGMVLRSASRINARELDEQMAAVFKETGSVRPEGLLAGIQDNVLAVSTFRIPAGLADRLSEWVSANPEQATALQGLEEQAGISVQDDLLSWLSGWGTLVITPGETVAGASWPATGYLSLASEQMGAASDGLDNVTNALKKDLAYGAVKLKAHSQNDIAWQLLQSREHKADFGGYGVSDHAVHFAIGKRTISQIGATTDSPLIEGESLKTASQYLPSPAGNLFYLDLPRSLVALRKALPDRESKKAFDDSPIFKALKSVKSVVGGSSTGIDKSGMASASVFIELSL